MEVILFKHSTIREMWQREKIQRLKVIIYKRKHDSAICPSHILYIATKHCCNRTVSTFYHGNSVNFLQWQQSMMSVSFFYQSNGACQYFTIATEHKHLIMATWLFIRNFNVIGKLFIYSMFYHSNRFYHSKRACKDFSRATEHVKILP